MTAPVISAGDLVGLLERVKAATGPDRRIDRELSVLPGGPNWRHEHNGCASYFRRKDKGEDGRTWAFASGPADDDFGTDLNDNAWPYYTASIDAALALVERVLPGWEYVLEGSRRHCCVLMHPDNEDGEGVFVENAPTAPLAILAAFLSARSALGEQPEVKE